MQGSLCLSQIIQFDSGAFVTNTLLILFPSVLQVALNCTTYKIIMNDTHDIYEYASFSWLQLP